MGVYRFPKGLIEELHKAFAKCWWGTAHGKDRMHWIRWEKLCEAKAFGGLNFRDMEVFNDALLAKQFWRIWKGINPLLFNIFKAKYFSRCSIWEAPLGQNPSLAWRSLWGSRALLKEGIIWKVGNGTKINIWKDAWVRDEKGKGLETPMDLSKADWIVKNLMKADGRSWDRTLIESIFSKRDTELILNTPISLKDRLDVQVWAASTDGNYSVKTGYWLGKHHNQAIPHNCWNIIWHCNLLPKVKNFLWKLCSNILPTKGNLFSRHISSSDSCDLCNVGSENSHHTFFTCSTVTHLWPMLDPILVLPPDKAFSDIIVDWHSSLDEERFNKTLVFLWLLWYRRNLAIFQQKFFNDDYWIVKCKDTVADLLRFAGKEENERKHGIPAVSQRWRPPEEGCIKVNSDARVSNMGWTGLGVVGRDTNGDVIFAAVKRVMTNWTPLVAEAQSMLFGLCIAKEQGWRRICCESDCLQLVNLVTSGAVSDFRVGNTIDDILDFSSVLESLEWNHVHRNLNSVAHTLAALEVEDGFRIWNNAVPYEVQSLIAGEKTNPVGLVPNVLS